MDLSYGYDPVGNILSLENKAAVSSDSAFGGQTRYSFGYDDLYRLTDSTGSWRQHDTEHSYTLAMAYDEIHNIVSKTRSDMRLSDEGDWIRRHKTTYDFVYAYGSSRPHAPTHIGERSFTYDANGNQTGWTSDNSGTRRIITWDEENRIQQIEDNGHLMTYKYNDAGERVFKTGPHGETVYLNQFFSVSNREGGSKHVFVGTSRIATKLVKGQDNVTTPGHSDPPGNAWGHSGNNGGGSGGGAPGNGAIIYEPDVFYYHPDHLGSTSFVTDLEGKVYQHLEYFPFGETWVEEVSDRWRVPYLFTAKELDRETGLYYFGARYYDPRTSVWQSTDPVLDDYLDGRFNSGVYQSENLGLYSYVANNPMKYVDPSGNDIVILQALNGAGGAGHTGMLVQRRDVNNGQTLGWVYYSRNGENKGSGSADIGRNPNQQIFNSPEAFFRTQAASVSDRLMLEHTENRRQLTTNENQQLEASMEYSYYSDETGRAIPRYDFGFRISTSILQDSNADSFASQHQNDTYYLIGNSSNCKDLVSQSLTNAGILNENHIIPNNWFKKLTESNNGTFYRAEDY